MRVFLTGATGFVGQRLAARLLGRGDEIVVLTRNASHAGKALHDQAVLVEGDPTTEGKWMSVIDGCDAVVNLAGEAVFGKRWSDDQKEKLRTSRVFTTENIVKAVAQASNKPKVMVSASSIGYYGSNENDTLTESSPPGSDLLANISQEWEQAAHKVEQEGIRLAIIRIGIVLHPSGGALARMVKPFKLGLGGIIGTGEQWVSWIHMEDLINLFILLLDDERGSGVFNGTAPQPIHNRSFCEALAQALNKPCGLKIPEMALKASLGEVAKTLAEGQRVIPSRTKEIEFSFQFPTITSALMNLVSR